MKISIVIPAYNAENYVIRTLESLKKQTYKNFEVKVVNDGSTDNTKNLILSFMNENKNMDIELINIENGGLANARNVGFKKCTGALYMNLDADDYIEDETLKSAVKVLEDKNIDICFFGYKSFERENEFYDYYEETKNYIESPISGIEAFILRIKRFIWICQGSALYRMSLIKENNISNVQGYNQGEDMYFISKCLLYAKQIYCVKADNFCCMNRKDSMNNSKYNKTFFEVILLLLKLKEEVKMSDLEEKEIIIHYIDIEFLSQYLALAKRSARHFDLKNYLKNFSQIPFHLTDVNFKPLSNDLSKTKKLELNIFCISKILYYIFVHIYDKRGKKS